MKNFIAGGEFITMTSENIKNGFYNKFLKDMQQKPILKGGDPSIPYLFTPMKKYERLDAEKYTGKNHFKLIDNYKSL